MRIGAIVGYAPLELGDAARPFLEEMARAPLFRGIRRILELAPDSELGLWGRAASSRQRRRPHAGGLRGGDPDPCWFASPQYEFGRGLEMLAAADLHFELLTREESQFDCALALMRAAPPDLRVVVQHFGGSVLPPSVFVCFVCLALPPPRPRSFVGTHYSSFIRLAFCFLFTF